MLPGFTEDGVLPPGDYEMTMEALATSRLVTGDGAACENWDKEWRAVLVGNLEVLVRQLWQVGIERVFADGSFVEDKAHPHDIDGYFECDTAYLLSGQLAADLNAIDPYKVWTWAPNSRRPDPKFSKVSVAYVARLSRGAIPALAGGSLRHHRQVRSPVGVSLGVSSIAKRVSTEGNHPDSQELRRLGRSKTNR
jgi:hypothetical protein